MVVVVVGDAGVVPVVRRKSACARSGGTKLAADADAGEANPAVSIFKDIKMDCLAKLKIEFMPNSEINLEIFNNGRLS